MAKKRLVENENIFDLNQKLKKAEEIRRKQEQISWLDNCFLTSTSLIEREIYNPSSETRRSNPPNSSSSNTLNNDDRSKVVTEEKHAISVNNVQEEEESNTANTSESNSEKPLSKESSSSKELDEELLQKKERILAFFEANKERGVTRKEATEYLAVKDFRTVKKKVKYLGILDVLKYVIDLRSNLPEGLPVYPDGYTSVDRVEYDNKLDSKHDEKSTLETEEPKEDRNLEVPTPVKTDDNNSVLLLSELFGVKQKKQNYILGLDMFNQRLDLFLELLDELLNQENIPCFWLWESDLIEMDKRKEESPLARHLIKFFAQDEQGHYSYLVDGEKPKNMIEFCKKNDIMLITGVPIDVLDFKLEGAKVKVPSFFKNMFPSPFNSNGKVIGFDSCAAFLKPEEIMPLLSDVKTLLLSDIQVREIPNNSYILRMCAYYGQVKKAEPKKSGNADQTIVNFYKTHSVDVVYTMDSGFLMFAKFAKIHCEFIKNKTRITSSKIFEKIDSIFSGEFKLDKVEQKRIRYDLKVNAYDGRFRIYTDSLVSVYSQNKYKRTSSLSYIEVYKGDYVVIRKNGKVLVSTVTNPDSAMGRILFFGLESDLPNEFKKFN